MLPKSKAVTSGLGKDESIFMALFGYFMTEYKISALEIKFADFVSLYKPKTVKILPVSGNIMELSRPCDFASFFGGFHELHPITADGCKIAFFNPEKPMAKNFMSLFTCPHCLDKLKMKDLINRLKDFQQLFALEGIM